MERIWLCPSIFLIPRSWSRVGFDTNVYLLLEHVHANGQRSLWSLFMCAWFSLRDLHFYFTFVSYFLVCDLESLEPRYKLQRASRNCTQATNCHSGGQLRHPRYYFFTVLAFGICSSICFWFVCQLTYMSAHRHVGLIAVFELALRVINYGLS